MTDAHLIQGDRGTITIAPAVLAQVVLRSVEAVDGARARRPKRGLEVDVDGDGRARVAVELAVRYGARLPAVAESVQREVADALRRTCGLEAEAVDVSVEELE